MSKGTADMVDAWDRLGIRPVNLGKVPELLDLAWGMPKKMTICLVGETGIGKTPIVHQWCANHDGYMRVLNFGHMSQEEVSMIMFTEQGDSFDFVPPKFLLDLNEEAEKRGCAVLFLDEWNRGDKALVNALFTLTDDRRIHNFHLHENVLVVAAMNPSDSDYNVNEGEKDSAIRKRLNFVYCVHDIPAMLKHAKKSGWHPLVPSFLGSASNYVYDQGARDAGKAFPCPSNWEKISHILNSAAAANTSLQDSSVRILVEGQIGTTAASKFMDFVDNENILIQPKEIFYDYTHYSNVRLRVASLANMKVNLNTGEIRPIKEKNTTDRTSILTELVQNTARDLFLEMPDAKRISPHLGLFIGDLPNEIMSSFLHSLQQEKKRAGDAGNAYFTKLNNLLAKTPEYLARLQDIVQNMQAMQRHIAQENNPG